VLDECVSRKHPREANSRGRLNEEQANCNKENCDRDAHYQTQINADLCLGRGAAWVVLQDDWHQRRDANAGKDRDSRGHSQSKQSAPATSCCTCGNSCPGSSTSTRCCALSNRWRSRTLRKAN